MYIWKRKSFLVLFVMCIVMLVPCSEQIVCQYDSSYTEWIRAYSMTEEHELSVLSMDDQHIMLSDVPYIENLRSLFSGTKTAAFRRANDLAMAMEARCYRGGEGRTKMKPLVYHSRDRVAYLVTAVYLAVIIVLGRFVPFHIWIF